MTRQPLNECRYLILKSFFRRGGLPFYYTAYPALVTKVCGKNSATKGIH